MRLGTCLAAVLAAGGLACAGVETAPRPVEPTRPPEADFLLDPVLDSPVLLDPETRERIRSTWRGLVSGSPDRSALDDVRRLLALDPDLPPARLVLAQELLVRGDPDAASDLLERVVSAFPDWDAARLAMALARERAGDRVAAYSGYLAASDTALVARERAAVLEGPAREDLWARFDGAVERGLWPDAREALDLLEEWSPEDTELLDARLRLAVRLGDEVAELEALREIVQARVPETGSWIRLAELEVAIGDLRKGLALAEDLAAESPEDARIDRILLRGRLSWRLQTAPAIVREIAVRNVVTRAELAALLYWLVPEIRTAPAGNPPIASDILDHPFRREILRVIDLGLLSVDRALHRFEPDAASTRAHALTALLRWMSHQSGNVGCLTAAGGLLRGENEHVVCSLAFDCSLVPSEMDCLPQAPVSGAEVVEGVARLTELLSPPG